jgi:hypothetical protein
MKRKLSQNHNRGQGSEMFLQFIFRAVEPLPAPYYNLRTTRWAGLAQLVELLICNKFIYFHKVHF